MFSQNTPQNALPFRSLTFTMVNRDQSRIRRRLKPVTTLWNSQYRAFFHPARRCEHIHFDLGLRNFALLRPCWRVSLT